MSRSVEHVGKGAKMRNGMKVVLVAALMSLTALAAAAQAANFSAWGTAQKIDEIGGQQLGAEHAVPGRLPDSVSGRAQPVHGVEPARRDRVSSTSGSPTGRARTTPGVRPRTSVSR